MYSNNQKYLMSVPVWPDIKIDRDIVFMSEFVLTDELKEKLGKLNYSIIPLIWEKEATPNIERYLEGTYSKMLFKIGEKLNEINGTNFPAEFWEVPMSAWLLHFLHMTYDRYSRLKYAVEKYGKESLTLVEFSSTHIDPANYSDFVLTYSCLESEHVSTFYGDVARAMGVEVLTEARDETSVTVFNEGENVRGFKPYIRGLIKSVLKSAIRYFSFNSKKHHILMDGMQFSTLEKLYFAFKLKALFFIEEYSSDCAESEMKVDRSQLLAVESENEFEAVAVKLLEKHTPEYLLEKFPCYQEQAKKWQGFKIYYGSLQFMTNILFAYVVAFGKISGSKIIGCQHGGGYALYERNHHEMMERSFCDYYVTWGWNDSLYSGATLIPLPQGKLNKLASKSSENGTHAVWAGCTIPRYIHRFQPYPLLSDYFPKYLSWKRNFIEVLDDDIKESLLYKLPTVDHGWLKDEVDLLNKYPEVKIKPDGKLTDMFGYSKLFIGDQLGTSMLESFVANVPTMLFWDKELTTIRKDASWAFAMLEEVGILFYDPKEAAQNANLIWKDVNGWWENKERQNARLEFMKMYALSGKDWKREWVTAFKNISYSEEMN